MKNRRIESSEVIGGGYSRRGNGGRQPGITPIEQWEGDFQGLPSFNNIEKILELPDTSDMAGVFSRAHFKSDTQRIAAVRLAYKNRKFEDTNHQEMLRDWAASTIGMGGLGKMLQVMAGTNLIAPDMIRAALGMPQLKQGKEEKAYRGSDFRLEPGSERDRE